MAAMAVDPAMAAMAADPAMAAAVLGYQWWGLGYRQRSVEGNPTLTARRTQ
jgi:hypothetical protein